MTRLIGIYGWLTDAVIGLSGLRQKCVLLVRSAVLGCSRLHGMGTLAARLPLSRARAASPAFLAPQQLF